jgi:hypothetical protein
MTAPAADRTIQIQLGVEGAALALTEPNATGPVLTLFAVSALADPETPRLMLPSPY